MLKVDRGPAGTTRQPLFSRVGRWDLGARDRTVVLAAASALLVAAPLAWNGLTGPSAAATPAAAPTSSAPTTASASPSVAASAAAPATTPSDDNGTTVPTATATPIARGNADAPGPTIDVDLDVPAGDPGGLAYYVRDDLHVDGTTRPLGTSLSSEVHLLAEDRALRLTFDPTDDFRMSATVLDRDGASVATVRTPTSGSLRAVATLDGTMFALEEDGADDATTGPLKVLDASGRLLAGQDDVVNRARVVGFAGGRVIIADDDPAVGRSYVWDLASNRIERLTDTGVVRAVDEASGNAAIESVAEDGEARCTTIADVTTGVAVPLSVTCGHVRPVALSPGGRYLLALAFEPGRTAPAFKPEQGEGSRDHTLRLIDTSTGEGIATFDASLAWGGEVRVEKDGSVVLDAVEWAGEEARTALVRCAPSGRCERLVDAVRLEGGDTFGSGYQLVRR